MLGHETRTKRDQYISNADSLKNKWKNQKPELFLHLLGLLRISEQSVAFKQLLYNDVSGKGKGSMRTLMSNQK